MVIWLVGLSGAGKTTLAKEIVRLARLKRDNVILLDGDQIRELFDHDLDYSMEGRKKSARRMSRLCQFLNEQGIHVVCSILCLFAETLAQNRALLGNEYYEVFIDAPLSEVIKRDVTGIYRKALAGEMTNVAGIDLPFLPPARPDLAIQNGSTKDALTKHAHVLSEILIGSPL